MFNITSDLQNSLLGRRQNANLKADIVQLTQEISSGKKADIQQALSGNIAPLASIARSLEMLESYDTLASNAATKFEYASNSIGLLQSDISGLGVKLLGATSNSSTAADQFLQAEKDGFSDAVQALQTRVGGQFVFSGENSNSPPLLDAEQMLAELRTATSGVTNAAVFYDTVDRWFTEPGNGFETVGYLGGTASTENVEISSTSSVGDPITAESLVIRAALRDLAMITLAAEGSFSGNIEEQLALGQLVGESLVSSADALTYEQASLGASEQSISTAQAQNAAERFSLSEAYNQITSTDLFEAASRLEEAQSQLESLYLITAKTSRLSLTEYLR